jgi:hypothetical protein
MAASVDDHPSAPDNAWLSAVFLATRANLQYDGLQLYSVRVSTDAQWTTSAGSPFGSASFGDRGTYLPIFRHRGVPVAGVVVTENGLPQPSDDYYFSDQSATGRTTIDPARNSTSANGSALLVDSALVNHSGEGAQPASGCVWPSDLGDAIPGVYHVHVRNSENNMGDDCQ